MLKSIFGGMYNIMRKKQFKTESKKLLDMMINSIYTHKEIFLRELISNASDALDKLYFRSLTDSNVGLSRADFAIWLTADKESRTLTITDNGCGMTKEELENNLGTIAKSGSFDFKNENSKSEEVDIIGQFGVGFYSAFMVADKITVESKPYNCDEAYVWESEGADGYTVDVCEKNSFGTKITLYLKADTDDERYSEYLEEYKIRALIKKYSDYIRYPIKMEIEKSVKKEGSESEYETKRETEVLNSMTPIWKRAKGEVTDEEYASFYTDKYYDYEAPLKVINQKSEGTSEFTALMFIPAHAPFDYYTKEYEKGLELYSSGVMIMERCADLLPDYFSFVKGLVDSQDLSLNISREMLQHDRQLKIIARAIEKKIKSELERMLEADREKYEKFFDAFGLQLKYGLYSDYGMHKDMLQDLVLFHSSLGKFVTLKEYTDAAKAEQKAIYYAAGESVDKIEQLPRVSALKSRGYEVLYLTDDVDEFALKMLGKYGDFEFKNATSEALDLDTEDEKKALETENDESKDMLDFIKESIGKVSSVRLSNSLGEHAVSLGTEGELSLEMEKILRKMPGADELGAPTANLVLEINREHKITQKLKELYSSDKNTLAKYAKILYGEACLVSGVSLESPVEFAKLVSELML